MYIDSVIHAFTRSNKSDLSDEKVENSPPRHPSHTRAPCAANQLHESIVVIVSFCTKHTVLNSLRPTKFQCRRREINWKLCEMRKWHRNELNRKWKTTLIGVRPKRKVERTHTKTRGNFSFQFDLFKLEGLFNRKKYLFRAQHNPFSIHFAFADQKTNGNLSTIQLIARNFIRPKPLRNNKIEVCMFSFNFSS